MTAPSTKNFPNGHFELTVDGHGPGSAIVKGVEGGMLKAASTEEPLAGFHLRGRHASTREIEPLSLEFGMSGARWALKQIEDVINRRQHNKVSGTILHADQNMVQQYSYQFSDARLTEISFPKCDAKSKEAAFIKVKLQPESIDFTLAKGAKLAAQPQAKHKPWLCSAFRLTIDDFSDATDFATTVEGLTIKIGAKPLQTGGFFRPQYNPTKIELPKLSFTVPLAYAQPLLDWYRAAIFNEKGVVDGGGRGGEFEHSGSLEFLDPTKTKTVYEIDFEGIGIEGLSILKSEANQVSTKMVKVDCYLTSMKLKPMDGRTSTAFI